jgi:hypothetical protein
VIAIEAAAESAGADDRLNLAHHLTRPGAIEPAWQEVRGALARYNRVTGWANQGTIHAHFT